MRARGKSVVVKKEGVGARAVNSLSYVLAGILFWSRGLVGRALELELERETRREEQSCARTRERGGEGARSKKGG